MIRYVVTGTMRSGTTYIANLLTAAGLDCTHETLYTEWDESYRPIRNPVGSLGDAAELTGPMVADLTWEDVTVVHLMRPPLDVIASVTTNALLDNDDVPHVRFVDTHVSVLHEPPGPRRAAAYWLGWTAMVQRHAHLRWDVSRLVYSDVALLADAIGAGVDPRRVVDALEQTPRQTNRWSDPIPVTLADLGDLGPVVADRADRYGLRLTAAE